MYKIMNNASLSISHMVGPAEKVTLADHPIEGFYFMTVGLSQVSLPYTESIRKN
ncbi:hypothetical protein LR48_Vigan2324s000100 [Vigna angularis]|nr:hypothetical protein LR48_Vigan2324s000100 [Vigna angularis]